MRARVAAALAASAALGLAACGGDDEPTTTTTAATASTTTSTAATSTTTSTTATDGAPIEELVASAAGVEPDEVECGDEEGIEGLIGSAGTCSAGGKEYVVADRGEELELDTLTARLADIEEARRASGDYLKPKPPKNDVFAIASLEITNVGNGTQVFDDFGEQAQLVTPTKIYREPFDVLNGVATDSFLWKATKIKPNRTAKGDVVFDVPDEVVDELDTTAAIQILNFGDEGTIRRAEQIGLLRTGESAS